MTKSASNPIHRRSDRGHHAFDVADDSDASREVIGRVLAFLRGHLGT